MLNSRACVEHLHREHQEAERLLSAFSAYLQRLRAEPATDIRDASALMDFLSEHFFQLHEEKEEEVLLPEMRRSGCPAGLPALQKIAEEHARGRSLQAALSESLSSGKPWSPHERAQFLLVGTAWLEFIRAHLRREERYFFPLVAEWIDEASDEILMREFERLDRESQTSEPYVHAQAEAETFVVRFENGW